MMEEQITLADLIEGLRHEVADEIKRLKGDENNSPTVLKHLDLVRLEAALDTAARCFIRKPLNEVKQ